MEIYKVMTIRKIILFFGVSTIFICFLLIYLMHDESVFPEGNNAKFSFNDNQWLHFENRLKKLESDFLKHQVEKNHEQEASQLKSDIVPNEYKYRKHPKDISIVRLDKPAQCNIDTGKTPTVDIQMLDVYRKVNFDNPDGGVWKQGWNIKYDDKQWHHNRKLRVFVVPHSHNDPGWLNTFEKYYIYQTQNILTNMANKLSEDKRRKFIWAEVSFFQLWWDDQVQSVQDTVKQLIRDGQLEIVAGGWVMPDESVSHWMAQLTQLTEGHQWLKQNLDYTPSTGWAIDPFGLSPTLPYLMKGSGLKHHVIQRTHYVVKKYLAKERNLEFRWRQLWDNAGTTELLTHMMPFYSYDVPHTCGPDPKVCCQFDFFRLPGFGLTCPWKVPPRNITNSNVAERAQLLLDQYRKKAQLYKTNVLLIPLGDDFRYAQVSEWNAQYGNYQRLFDYMNSNENLNVHAQFGTLQDYFDALEESNDPNHFPSLSGDFFTYADRDDNYWSGYYTSRPFHKRLDRVLLASLRNAEVLSSSAWMYGNHQLTEGNLATRMSIARKWHSLFQHHDGVTGTARDNVVVDYAQKMIVALNNSAHVLQQSIAHLLKTSTNTPLDTETVYLSLDESRSHHTSTGERYILSLGEETTSRKVVFYNSLPRGRAKVQTLFVSTPFVRVTNSTGHSVKCQISPVWVGPAALSSARYEVSFVAAVPALGLSTYVVHALHDERHSPDVYFSNVTIFNVNSPPQKIPGFSHITTSAIQEFSITYGLEYSASFGKSGLLKSIRAGDSTVPVHLTFKRYGTRHSGDKSGAYLFLPEKPEPDSIPLDSDRIIHLIQGPIISKVYIDLPYVRHTCVLYNSTGLEGQSLQIFNEVDITETSNFELVMRLETDIQSEDLFYTDLNGLNMIKRQRFAKIPIQGNYYPMAAAGYIEDGQHRMTVLTAQPLGISSLASGQLDIMQDRRLNQDDNRGLGHGVLDNLLTIHKFSLILEKKIACNSRLESPDHPSGLLSLGGHLGSEDLLHPIVALHPRETDPKIEMTATFSPLRSDFPADISLVNMRIFPIPEGAGKGIGLTLHRKVNDFCWGSKDLLDRFTFSNNGQVDLKNLLSSENNWIISNTPLTFHTVGSTRNSSVVDLCPHEVKSVLIHKHSMQINF